jgi:hypothetical protein
MELSHFPTLRDFQFLEAFPRLKYLSVSGCRKIMSFDGLEKCRHLEHFSLGDSNVENKDLRPLAQINNVGIGLRYKKPLIQEFDKIFQGKLYSIGRFEKGKFDYLAFYERYFRSRLREMVKLI